SDVGFDSNLNKFSKYCLYNLNRLFYIPPRFAMIKPTSGKILSLNLSFISCSIAGEEEFAHLHHLLEELAAEYPIVGSPQEVIERVKGNGYTTPYYFISPYG